MSGIVSPSVSTGGEGVGVGVAVGVDVGVGVGVGAVTPQAASVRPTASQAAVVDKACCEPAPNDALAAASVAARALHMVALVGKAVKPRKKMRWASARPMPLTVTSQPAVWVWPLEPTVSQPAFLPP